MAFVEIKNIAIKGIAACVPKQVESNLDYDRLTEKERAKLIKTTGVEFRRIANENTTASDLSFEAARTLMDALNWEANEIDVCLSFKTNWKNSALIENTNRSGFYFQLDLHLCGNPTVLYYNAQYKTVGCSRRCYNTPRRSAQTVFKNTVPKK